MNIKFKRLDGSAKAPTYATDGSACMDVSALHGGWIEPGEAFLFETGLAFEVPAGHVMLVYSRSGMGFNHDTRLSNAVGVLDSDYRGQLMIKLRNDGHELLTVNAGDRIAQFMILPCPKFSIIEEHDLSNTSRGVNGLGSTGK
jgi:dUTP pyrophosphatase